MVLTHEEVKANINEADGWKLEGDDWIMKSYTLSSYPKAIQFVNAIADIAEDRQHHPYTIIDHKNVTLKLSTIDEGGLTQKDFESAHAYDKLFDRYS
ncbi:4a-hydroxytetrahydrobiopterin dehydratase [Bacillus daqingensis]|uniref:4a-hydroxytetrahydrobiopterin dehydratase n=1 Tax=Bacillus daqingensis TaxID=872396 RepID=A0ABV9NVI4_9BACI